MGVRTVGRGGGAGRARRPERLRRRRGRPQRRSSPRPRRSPPPSTTASPTVRTVTISTSPPVSLDTDDHGGGADHRSRRRPRRRSTTRRPACPSRSPPPADPNAPEPVNELGTIEIPKIDVTKRMFEGVTLTTLNRGPGHWPGTAMPGQVGNVVIGGHRTSHDKPFRHIDELDPGDEVDLHHRRRPVRLPRHVVRGGHAGRGVDHQPDAGGHRHPVRLHPARLHQPSSRRAPRPGTSLHGHVPYAAPTSALRSARAHPASPRRRARRLLAPAVGVVAARLRRHRHVRGRPRSDADAPPAVRLRLAVRRRRGCSSGCAGCGS